MFLCVSVCFSLFVLSCFVTRVPVSFRFVSFLFVFCRRDGPAPAGDPIIIASAEVNQVFWWIKVMQDDPVRLLRCLRFAAKLDYDVHEDFWLAVPFAMEQMQAKVAGSRKTTEMNKIASYGGGYLQRFMELCFERRFTAPLVCAAGAAAAASLLILMLMLMRWLS
jgi:hypothetical protein